MADRIRVMENFVDVLFKAERTVLKDTGLQIDESVFVFYDLEFRPDGIAEGAVEGLTGGDFRLVENIENEISAGSEIGIYILENLMDMYIYPQDFQMLFLQCFEAFLIVILQGLALAWFQFLRSKTCFASLIFLL